MKHTSIRLTDEHAKKIEATGKKPSIVVRQALDAYFGIPPDDSEPLKKLIEEHVRVYHSAQPAHIASTEIEAQRAQNVRKASAQLEHIEHTDEAQRARDVRDTKKKLSKDRDAQEQVKEMWKADPRPTYQQIGTKLGYNKGTIYSFIQKSIKAGELPE